MAPHSAAPEMLPGAALWCIYPNDERDLMHTHSPTGGVVLNQREHEITDLFLQIVVENDHLSLTAAARYALNALPHPDPDFVDWLLQGQPREFDFEH